MTEQENQQETVKTESKQSESYLVIRLRSAIGKKPEVRDTANILKLRKINSFIVVPKSYEPMLRKVEGMVTWGEPSQDVLSLINGKSLKVPKGGFASMKRMYPKGELGYRGGKINDLAKRMIG